jgi:hypothetical protein
MKPITLSILVIALSLGSPAIPCAQEGQLNCVKIEMGEVIMESGFRPELAGSYTYGLWRFRVRSGDSHTFGYDSISASASGGIQVPGRMPTAMKAADGGTAIFSMGAPLELFSLDAVSTSGDNLEYSRGGILDAESGGLGFRMIQGGVIEVLVLLKDIEPSDLRSFSLAGFDAISN